MAKEPCVYIRASRRHGTIYIGVTSNLIARLYQHRTTLAFGFEPVSARPESMDAETSSA